MKGIKLIMPLLLTAPQAQAHVADMAWLQRGLEHGWLALLPVPLLLLLLPQRGRSR
jgi:hypothetical protein